MLDALALEILEAAYDLSRTSEEALRTIVRLAIRAVPRGSATGKDCDADAELDRHLAVAWQIRTALCASAITADPGLRPPATSPRNVLRHAVLAPQPAPADAWTGKRALWQALIAGQWSVLDAFTTAGTRYIVAHQNPGDAATLRALLPRERIALDLALAGRSGKWIAFELQLSESVVARTLGSALRRLGVADITALAGVRTAMFEPLDSLDIGATLAVARSNSTAIPAAGLSDAERVVVAGLLGGMGIAAIAEERRTSPRTVANQIASAYRKLGVSSRRELLALLT